MVRCTCPANRETGPDWVVGAQVYDRGNDHMRTAKRRATVSGHAYPTRPMKDSRRPIDEVTQEILVCLRGMDEADRTEFLRLVRHLRDLRKKIV